MLDQRAKGNAQGSILGKIVHNGLRNSAAEGRRKR